MLRSLLRRMFTSPLLLCLLPCVMSFAAFLVPQDWYGRRWAFTKIQLDLTGYEYLTLWFALIVATTAMGSAIGARLCKHPFQPLSYDNRFRLWYLMVSGCAALGLLSSIIQVAHAAGFGFIIESLTRGVANNIHDALYANYAIGLGSLRYLTIIAGGTGAFLLISRPGADAPLHIVNIALLLISSLISSRLSLMAGSVVFLVLYARSGVRMRMGLLATWAVVLLITLMVANETRTRNSYAESGITNPIAASMAEELTYLGSPFQGALATAHRLASGDDSEYTGIDASLTTNSAFEGVQRLHGTVYVFTVVPVTLLVCSILFAYVVRTNAPALVAGAGAWGYGFTEIWRVFFFGAGIWWVLIIFGFLFPAAILCFVRTPDPRPKAIEIA
jgi:hypothetical protein